MENQLDSIIKVVVIAGSLILWGWQSYRKMQKTSRPVIMPEEIQGDEPTSNVSPEAPQKEEVVAEYRMEDLPPIPPLAQQTVNEKESEEKYKEQPSEENNRIENILGMDIRQAIIVSEILKRKY